MFVPPWMDPIDPNIDPLIAQQVNMLGAAMAVDLTAAGKKGVVVHGIYDYFAPARHYQSYHGGMRLLSEAASVRYATPVTVPFSSLQTRGRGYNARQRSWNFLEPWPGGEWTLSDIIDYQLITFDSCLYNAALHRTELLENFYRIGRRTIDEDSPWAFVIPRSQHDANAMTRLLKILEFGMVEIDPFRRGLSSDRAAVPEGRLRDSDGSALRFVRRDAAGTAAIPGLAGIPRGTSAQTVRRDCPLATSAEGS